MQPLTCPIPTYLNPLQNNGFLFDVLKLPTLKFYCQSAILPSISLPSASKDTPLTNIPMPGDKMTFGELQISFMVDENMDNYVGVRDWIVGMGFPESHQQYQNFISGRTNSINTSPTLAAESDCILQVLSSTNNPIRTIRFVDAFPTSLQQLEMQSTTTDTVYQIGQATFEYTYYTFE